MQAQPADDPFYVLVRGSLAGADGDLGGTFSQPGLGLGAEGGHQLSPRLALGLGLWYQNLPALSNGFRFEPQPNDQGSTVVQVQALARYRPLPRAFLIGSRRAAPFVEGGLAVVAGQGTENERNRDGSEARVWGFGPVVGLGAHVELAPQVAFHLGVQSMVVFPDVALDGADPGAFVDEPTPPAGALADKTGYDVLTNVAVGVRYSFALGSGSRVPTPVPMSPAVAPAAVIPEPLAEAPKPLAEAPEPLAEGVVPVEIQRLACPSDLEAGRPGRFALTLASRDRAASVTWQWGDDTSGAGTSASHVYGSAGVYTVTATVDDDMTEASRTCLVSVAPPPTPLTLAACRATPSLLLVGDALSIEASVGGAEQVEVDFGDGTTASALPARHVYTDAGGITVTITAANERGAETCTVKVLVQEPAEPAAQEAPVAPVEEPAEPVAPVTQAEVMTDAPVEEPIAPAESPTEAPVAVAPASDSEAPPSCTTPPTFEPVPFGFGSAQLTEEARSRLDESYQALSQCPTTLCLSVNAYGDPVEPDGALATSRRRADAIRFYLIGQGYDADRIQAVGRGVDPAPVSVPDEDPGLADRRARRADLLLSVCPR